MDQEAKSFQHGLCQELNRLLDAAGFIIGTGYKSATYSLISSASPVPILDECMEFTCKVFRQHKRAPVRSLRQVTVYQYVAPENDL